MRSFRSLFTLGAVAIVAAACSETPTQTEAPLAGIATFDQVEGDGTVSVTLCKIAWEVSYGSGVDDGTLGEPFTFEISATDGETVSPVTMPAQDASNLDPDDCREVWTNPGVTFDDQTQITITEIVPAGFSLRRINSLYGGDGAPGYEINYPEDPSITFSPYEGRWIFFKNRAEDLTFGGCTPGYWRQPHHYDNWVGYEPSDLFNDVFGVGPTAVELGEAVQAKGGGEQALVRHAVAALLNAVSPDVDYAFSEAEVISMVQDAYASGNFEWTKNQFETQNELGCDLD